MSRAVALALLAMVLSGCAEPPELADWTIPVPEGTPVIQYAPVSSEQRAGKALELRRDLVIGGDGDAASAFYLPADLAVDQQGRIWVLDARRFQVQVFDAGGGYLRSVGRRGEGPGELQSPQEVAIAGGRLFVITNHRMNVWNLEGEHLDTVSFGPVNQLYTVGGTPAGDLLVWHRVFEGRLVSRGRVTRVGPDGREIDQLFDVPEPRAPTIVLDGEERSPSSVLGWWIPRAVAARSGDVYVTGGDEYQILRIDPDGRARWALQVAWPRAEITDEEVDSAFAELRERQPEATREQVYSWGHQPAVVGIAADGHDNLWVFPWVRDPLERDERPVDVYSKDGELLFAGTIPVRRRISIVGEYTEDLRWLDALDDFVYTFGVDPQTEEHLVVRYRIAPSLRR